MVRAWWIQRGLLQSSCVFSFVSKHASAGTVLDFSIFSWWSEDPQKIHTLSGQLFFNMCWYMSNTNSFSKIFVTFGFYISKEIFCGQQVDLEVEELRFHHLFAGVSPHFKALLWKSKVEGVQYPWHQTEGQYSKRTLQCYLEAHQALRQRAIWFLPNRRNTVALVWLVPSEA